MKISDPHEVENEFTFTFHDKVEMNFVQNFKTNLLLLFPHEVEMNFGENFEMNLLLLSLMKLK